MNRYQDRDPSLKWASVAAADVMRHTHRLARQQGTFYLNTVHLLRVLIEEPTVNRFLNSLWSEGVDRLRKRCEDRIAIVSEMYPLGTRHIQSASEFRHAVFCAREKNFLIVPMDMFAILANGMMYDANYYIFSVYENLLPQLISDVIQPFRLPSNSVRVVTRRRESRPVA